MRLHLFHDWSKWKTIKSGILSKRTLLSHEWADTGIVEHQERVCQTCGRKELRTIETGV